VTRQGLPDSSRWELTLNDPLYPASLKASPWPPKILYGFGDPTLFRAASLSIVGSRRATPYGTAAAERFGTWAGEHGVTVVSGAATGCDLTAQKAALQAGGVSIAVLGHGADLDYPRSAAEVLSKLRVAGLVISEHPWGTTAQPWMFRARNRIIAGLSAAVLIVEAAMPSGTFSTADYALDAGRDVFAVPGSIFAPECRGPNRLIRQGATPITDVNELRESLEELVGSLPRQSALGLCEPAETRYPDDPVGRALIADPMRPDDVAWSLGMDITDVIVTIARLESEGVIRRYPGDRYGPC